jgi:glutathione S-transferase
MEPIILHGSGATPNPIKVAIVLEELKLPFTINEVNIQKGEHKQEPFVSLNPNGRLPAIEDPNTGVKLFEVRCAPSHLHRITAHIEPSLVLL